MQLAAIIPVKELRLAKSRLSRILKPHMRRELIMLLLEIVMDACVNAKLDKTYVLGKDKEVEELAREHGCVFYRDSWESLNESLEGASKEIFDDLGYGMMVIPCDLPLISAGDILNVKEMLRFNDVVISPSIRLNGTNLLTMKRAGAVKFQYGRSSFKKHIAYARSCNMRVAVYFSFGVGLDIDRPEDISMLRRMSRRGYPMPERLRSLSYLRL